MIQNSCVMALLLLTSLSATAATTKDTVPDILDASALKDGSDGKPAIDPCKDFYHFSCGGWIEKAEIPADKSSIMHQSTALIDQTDQSLNDLLLKLEKGSADLKTASSHQLLDFYHSCLNYKKTTPAARSLLKQEMDAIARIQSKAELAPLIAHLQLIGVNAFFNFSSGQDLKDSNSVIGFLDQGGMALPEPSYYFEKDEKSVDTRKKYEAHIAKVLGLIGQKKTVAANNAKAVLAFETELASKAYSFDDRQDPAKINHPITREELNHLAPHFDWAAYFKALSAPTSALNVNEPGFFSKFDDTLQKTSLADLKTNLIWQLAHRSAEQMDAKLDEEHFDFWGHYLHGETKMKPRWKQCTQQVERKLGYALAEVYVKTVDTVAIRSKIEAMINDIKQTFQDDLKQLSNGKDAWLDPVTEQEALKKLSFLRQKVGSPSQWRDYSSLKTDRSSYLANDFKTIEFENKRDLNKIGKPTDRTEWDMMPWVINAYYDPPKNEFVFPFGILQPPSFDLKASDGANLGSFGGGTIGHELTHGYDNDGRQYDANGNFKDWWTPDTKKRFQEKSQCFVDQANHYKIEEVGLNVDGQKSLPENLADQGGVKLGYSALLLEQTKRAPSAKWMNKYTENQQYWISYAQSWCSKMRPESLRVQIKTNPHPPSEFRVNGVVMNRPEFAKDFACKTGDAMAPANRCSIW